MSKLNKILLSLTIFVLLLIGGTCLLLAQSAKQGVEIKKIELTDISESSFIHKDWPLTIDPDFVPGGIIATSSSEIFLEVSSVSSVSKIYSQISSISSATSVSNSTKSSISSKKTSISSIVNQISSREEVEFKN